MAEAMGQSKAAAEYLAVFEPGRAKYDRMLFNGEYYTQKVFESPKSLSE